MTMTFVTGLIGLALLVGFLGIMLTWIKALPLIIIVLVILTLVAYDFYEAVAAQRRGGDAARPPTS